MMINHYFKVALRLIKRSFLFSSIHILGFVWGMAAAFLIYLWVIDEFTFEDHNPDAGRIFRVIEANCSESGEVTENPYTSKLLADAFRKEFPQVEEATYLGNVDMTSLRSGDKFLSLNWMRVDTAFFDVFHFPVVEGDPGRLKSGFNHIVLSETLAKKFFGMNRRWGKK